MPVSFVLKADEVDGKSFGTSQQRNPNSVAGDNFSQDVTEIPKPVDFNPFYSETGAVRVVTVSDDVALDFDLTTFPSAVVASAVDVSDASGLLVYGALEMDNPPPSAIEVVISPFAMTSDDKPGVPLPRFALRPVSPHLGMYGSSPEQEHYFREENVSLVRFAFDPVWLPTFGADKIGLYVTFSTGQTTERLILHATKTSFTGNIQQLYTDIFDDKWSGGNPVFGDVGGS